jgi:hypothetical protein
MGHISPVINKVPLRSVELILLQGIYVPCPVRTSFITGAIYPMPMWNFIYYRVYMSHAHVELYLLQGLYVPCPCGTLFITGVICPMPMWNFIYYRGYMSHAHVELHLLQGLYVPCPRGTFIAPVMNKVPHGNGTYSPCNK